MPYPYPYPTILGRQEPCETRGSPTPSWRPGWRARGRSLTACWRSCSAGMTPEVAACLPCVPLLLPCKGPQPDQEPLAPLA